EMRAYRLHAIALNRHPLANAKFSVAGFGAGRRGCTFSSPAFIRSVGGLAPTTNPGDVYRTPLHELREWILGSEVRFATGCLLAIRCSLVRRLNLCSGLH